MPDDDMLLRHSTSFVRRFSECAADVFGWTIRDGFSLIRPLFSPRATAVYAPILSCTDLTVEEAKTRLPTPSGRRTIIKTLGSEKGKSLVPGDPVLMRLPLRGRTEGEILAAAHVNCRRNISKANRAGVTVHSGNGQDIIREGYAIHQDIMHRHGTPALPLAFFLALAQKELGRMYVARHASTPVAMLWAMQDGHICWIPWCGALADYRSLCPNQATHVAALQDALQNNAVVFDFGRSPYEAGTYEYKRRWGARAVPLTYLSNHAYTVYQKKYAVAATVWKKLPASFINQLGPRLCRHLPEL